MPQYQFAPTTLLEVVPNCIHPRIVRRVIFEMKQSAPILGELPIHIEGVLQTFGVGWSLGGGGGSAYINHLKGGEA